MKFKGKVENYLFGCCYKIDCCVIAIILLRKTEGELIVNEKSICKECMEKVISCPGTEQTSAKQGTMIPHKRDKKRFLSLKGKEILLTFSKQ